MLPPSNACSVWNALFTLAFSADVWQSLSPSDAPAARYSHSAVWSSEVDGMYVFLGTGASDLQFYNRGANTWQLVSPSGSAPSVNNAVWSSQMDGMLIFGGKALDTCCDNNLYYYSRQGNSWSQLHPTGTKPIARYGHSVVWSPSADGIYVFGGLDSLGTRYDDLHFFDRQGNAWQALSPTGFGPSARSGHSAVWSAAADGMYIYAGYSTSAGVNNDLYFYDRSTNNWQHVNNGYGSRTDHVAVWSPSADGMYVFGGETSGGNVNDLTFFDRQAQSWENIFPGGTLPEARSTHTAVWSPEVNGMFVFAGFGTNALNDLHFYGALGAASTPSAVVGDPITWYKGKKVKFWFPPGELLLILKTPELKLWASTFTGPSIDFQWFGRFVVTTVEGLEMVAVQVRRGAVKQNTSDFEELVVAMGGRPLRGRGSRLYAGANGTRVAVGVRSFTHLANGNLEFVMVESPSISFMIHASPAATEFPEDAEKQLEFRHLDWIHLESPSTANFTGILAQLWGLEARSPEVDAMLVAPSQRELKAHAMHSAPVVACSC